MRATEPHLIIVGEMTTRPLCNREVPGSNPVWATTSAVRPRLLNNVRGVVSATERHLIIVVSGGKNRLRPTDELGQASKELEFLACSWRRGFRISKPTADFITSGCMADYTNTDKYKTQIENISQVLTLSRFILTLILVRCICISASN